MNRLKTYFKLWPSLLLFSILNNCLEAQISEKGTPKSFTKSTLKAFTDIPFVTMPSFNVSEMLKEDTSSNPLFPFRFAKGFKVSYSLNNSGLWETLDNGDKIWRLGIKSPGAYGIIVSFSEYDIPDSAKVFIFNTKMNYVIGAFTSKNNTKYRILPTEPVKGDEIDVEYFEPKNVKQQGKLTIGSIGHDYKGIVNGFNVGGYGGTPLSCEVNTICAAPNWQNEKHAVNRICYQGSDNNFYLCTAALINNTAQDGTPYDLTAQHCICNSSEANSVVALFNYESPTCTPTGSGSLTQTISIATLVASIDSSDCALIKLSSIPPSSYTPYYLGWDRTGSTPTGTVTCIHHPTGAVKKISTSSYGLSTISYFLTGSCTSINKDCWLLTKWTTGDVESGSSGAPLLNNNARVIGQVYGDENGTIGCPGTSLTNLFGRFFKSWTGGGTSSTQLSHWLDPLGLGVTTLNGGYYLSLSASSTLVCSSGTTTFTINNLIPNNSVNWNSSSNFIFQSNPSTSTAIYMAKANAAGSGWVTATNGSVTSAPCTVWNDVPVFTSILGPYSTPNHHEASFSVQPDPNEAITSYTWNLNPLNGNTLFPSGPSLIIAFYNTGNYQLLINAHNICGTGPIFWRGVNVYASNSLMISPNPASTTINVTIVKGNTITASDSTSSLAEAAIADDQTRYTVSIFNSFGTQFLSIQKNSNPFSLQVDNLKNGMYIVVVSDGKYEYSRQLVVKH